MIEALLDIKNSLNQALFKARTLNLSDATGHVGRDRHSLELAIEHAAFAVGVVQMHLNVDDRSAIETSGTTLHVKLGDGTWSKVTEVSEVTPPAEGWIAGIQGLKPLGPISFVANFKDEEERVTLCPNCSRRCMEALKRSAEEK